MRYLIKDEDFIVAIKNNVSIRAVLLSLGMKETGGAYHTFRSRVKRLNIDTSHFTGQSTHKKGNYKKPISLKEILVIDSNYSSNALRKRLIKENILENKCNECGIIDWNEKPISLHLDHINGVHTDNRLENLQILCPNCHSQTSTFGGKNIKKLNKRESRKCLGCGKDIKNRGKNCLCSNCFIKQKNKNPNIRYKIEWPSIEDLEKMLLETNYTQVAKKLGVSDNAIRKHIQKYKNKV